MVVLCELHAVSTSLPADCSLLGTPFVNADMSAAGVVEGELEDNDPLINGGIDSLDSAVDSFDRLRGEVCDGHVGECR